MYTDLLISIAMTGFVATFFGFALMAANNTNAARQCRREWQKAHDEVDGDGRH